MWLCFMAFGTLFMGVADEVLQMVASMSDRRFQFKIRQLVMGFDFVFVMNLLRSK